MRSVVAVCREAGVSDKQTLATVLLTLTLTTLVVGVAIVVVGEAPAALASALSTTAAAGIYTDPQPADRGEPKPCSLSGCAAFHIAGRLRLASTVQYMPLSVIGGYLGYVGFFICISGAGVSTGNLPMPRP